MTIIHTNRNRVRLNGLLLNGLLTASWATIAVAGVPRCLHPRAGLATVR